MWLTSIRWELYRGVGMVSQSARYHLPPDLISGDAGEENNTYFDLNFYANL